MNQSDDRHFKLTQEAFAWLGLCACRGLRAEVRAVGSLSSMSTGELEGLIERLSLLVFNQIVDTLPPLPKDEMQ
jgi:hypothetical protein